MRHSITVAGSILLALGLAACAPSRDLTQMQSNESSLRELVASDRQQIEELQEKLRRQNDRIAELEHNDQDQDNDKADEAPAASAAATPGELMTPAAAPSPASDSAAAAPPASGDAANPDAAAAPDAASTPGTEVAAVAPPAVAAPVSPAPTWQSAVSQELAARQNDPAAKLYRAGLVELKAGKFQPALAKFQDLQRRYPKSSLSEPAEYFSGTALYAMGQHEKSILQFNDLTMRYPEGRFASAALLSEAQAFVKINDQIDARLTLQKLLNEHPAAPEAPTAKSMMDSLSS